MVKKPGNYIPKRGDIIWVDFLSVQGKGRRPALILSPEAYHKKVGLALCCPVTSHVKGYPFEVEIGTYGAVLVNHIRSIDFNERNCSLYTKCSKKVLSEVMHKLLLLLPDTQLQ